MLRETLYAAYEPARTGGKWAMYQWSLPDTDARHVPESIAHTCMAQGCSRHFGLLGELVDQARAYMKSPRDIAVDVEECFAVPTPCMWRASTADIARRVERNWQRGKRWA